MPKERFVGPRASANTHGHKPSLSTIRRFDLMLSECGPRSCRYPIRAAIAYIVQVIQRKRALASIASVSILHCMNDVPD